MIGSMLNNLRFVIEIYIITRASDNYSSSYRIILLFFGDFKKSRRLGICFLRCLIVIEIVQNVIIRIKLYLIKNINYRVVNDTQSQSFETVSNAKIKVSKQYQMLNSKFRNSIKN